MTRYRVREHVNCDVIFLAVRVYPSLKLPSYAVRLLFFFSVTQTLQKLATVS